MKVGPSFRDRLDDIRIVAGQHHALLSQAAAGEQDRPSRLEDDRVAEGAGGSERVALLGADHGRRRGEAASGRGLEHLELVEVAFDDLVRWQSEPDVRLESLPLLRDGDERGLRSRDEDGVATAPDELLETVHERRGVGERVGQKVALATAPGPEPCAEPGAGHGSDSVAGPFETSARTEYRTLLRIGDENALHHVDRYITVRVSDRRSRYPTLLMGRAVSLLWLAALAVGCSFVTPPVSYSGRTGAGSSRRDEGEIALRAVPRRPSARGRDNVLRLGVGCRLQCRNDRQSVANAR